MVGSLAFAFYCSWRVSLVIMTLIPLMTVSTGFLVKMTQTQTSRANSSYAKAGAIVYTAISSIRTILALNAVEELIRNFHDATQEAFEGASSQVIKLGLANGLVMGVFCIVYIPVTLYGTYLLYDNVRKTGCDPSGAVFGNVGCSPSAFGVFGACLGMTFAGSVLPQVSGAVESFTGARSGCYPALLAISRKTDSNRDGVPEDDSSQHELIRRGSTAPLPKYIIDSSSEDGLKPEAVIGDISFDDVTFSYPTRQEVNVFNGFSLEIKAGQTVAICGPR
jgi:ATP-binding cassette subfamily B (MDR/TAP) protein 1